VTFVFLCFRFSSFSTEQRGWWGVEIIIITWQSLQCCHDGQSHFESSPGSLDECRCSTWWPPALTPSQSTWAVSLPVGCCHPHHHRHLLLLLSLKADTHFTVLWRVEGLVDLGTAVPRYSPYPRLYVAAAVVVNTAICDEIQHWVFSHRSQMR